MREKTSLQYSKAEEFAMSKTIGFMLAVAVVASSVTSAFCAEATQSISKTQNKGGKVMIHELPPLPYDYNALEPYYDEQTVRIHHDKHHLAYVNGLNKAEEKLAEARQSSDFALIQHWERQLAFHASGDILHTLFWQSMAPNASKQPVGELAEQIETDFGSFDAFRNQFSQAAITVEGNGWAALAWSPDYNKLYIVQIENHQKQTVTNTHLLMVLDMWEHAYYLKFQNRRPDWVESWWNIVNWDGISERFKEIKAATSK